MCWQPGPCSSALWSVCIHPCSFLLEAGGSINYFGGLAAIRDTISRELTERWKHVFYQATTPHAHTASLMLARAGCNLVVERGADLRSVLGPLSIEVLPLDDKRKQQLNKTGVRILRDLWRLPSDGLARRFGTELVTHLDQALGKLPEPLNAYRIPPRFSDTRECSFDIDEQQALLPVVRGACDRLMRFPAETGLVHHGLPGAFLSPAGPGNDTPYRLAPANTPTRLFDDVGGDAAQQDKAGRGRRQGNADCRAVL